MAKIIFASGLPPELRVYNPKCDVVRPGTRRAVSIISVAFGARWK